MLLFLIFLSFYFIAQPRKSSESSPDTQIAVPLQEEEPIPPPKELPKIAETKELELEIAFLYDTWIQVYADGELVLNGLKKEGEQARVKAGQELIVNRAFRECWRNILYLERQKGKGLGNIGCCGEKY